MINATSPEQLNSLDRDHLWHPFTRMKRFEPGEHMLVRAEGCYVWDAKGRKYLDGFAGLWSVNVGHNHPDIIAAIVAQLQMMATAPLFGSAHPTSALLAARLAEIAPGNLNRVFLSVQGSQAVETALKLSRQYWRSLGRGAKYKFISRNRAYHGTAFGGMSAQGVAENRANFEPLVPGFSHIAAPYPYRCSWCAESGKCNLSCADDLEREIVFQGPETVAGFIAEPLMGTGGVIPAPAGYLPVVRQICDRYEVLFIADEVMTGFGRTGRMFAIEHDGTIPDMLLVSKGLTSGHLPLAATIVTDALFETVLRASSYGPEFASGNTFDGYPPACAAALENLAVLDREGLIERSAALAPHFQNSLQSLSDHALVGEVRGLGLVAGIELVADKQSRVQFPARESVAGLVAAEVFARGAIVRPLVGGAVIAVAPPLTISADEISSLTKLIREGLDAVHALPGLYTGTAG